MTREACTVRKKVSFFCLPSYSVIRSAQRSETLMILTPGSETANKKRRFFVAFIICDPFVKVRPLACLLHPFLPPRPLPPPELLISQQTPNIATCSCVIPTTHCRCRACILLNDALLFRSCSDEARVGGRPSRVEPRRCSCFMWGRAKENIVLSY